MKDGCQLPYRFLNVDVLFLVNFLKKLKANANSIILPPSSPYKDGYIFTNWYKDRECTQAWNFAAEKVTSNITLYAGWGMPNAEYTYSRVFVNGRNIDFDAYSIDGHNYFKLRDLAIALDRTTKNFDVTWDGSKNAINLISNRRYTPVGGELGESAGSYTHAAPCTSAIYKDGVEVSLKAYTIHGNNYFKLRDIAQAFNFGVIWDRIDSSIYIDTSIDYVP